MADEILWYHTFVGRNYNCCAIKLSSIVFPAFTTLYSWLIFKELTDEILWYHFVCQNHNCCIIKLKLTDETLWDYLFFIGQNHNGYNIKLFLNAFHGFTSFCSLYIFGKLTDEILWHRLLVDKNYKWCTVKLSLIIFFNIYYFILFDSFLKSWQMKYYDIILLVKILIIVLSNYLQLILQHLLFYTLDSFWESWQVK